MINLSIDAFGGDHAPDAIIAGVALAAKKRPDLQFLIAGKEDEVSPLVARHASLGGRCAFVDVPDRIPGDMKPSQALRQGKNSSMWAAVQAVADGRVRAAVSAGNTGALMAISKLRLRMVEGVHRPAIAAIWPTRTGFATVLDVGANVDADVDQLIEFAIMGEAYHRAIHGVAHPKVALLNIGSEDQKGHEEIREAASRLKDPALGLTFCGFVEGDGISSGEVDVVVSDGFTGNVALKTAEGTARLVGAFLKDALTAGPISRLGALIASPGLLKLKARMDPRAVNGGVFLGLNGLVVKSHGGTDDIGFAAAIDVAARLAGSDFQAEVAHRLSIRPSNEVVSDREDVTGVK
jgi:phosphate acyltransferase